MMIHAAPVRAPFRALLLAALMPVLAGCSALTGIGSAPAAVYDLRPPAGIVGSAGRTRALDVIVEVPTTGGALDTDRIMIRPGPLEAQYLPDVRWAEPTPVLVQTLMLRTLDASGGFQYVGRQPLGPSGDFAIVTELVDFHAELDPDGRGAAVVVRMVSRIVREDGVRIVASRSFAATERAVSLSDADLVDAFDAAAQRMIADFAGWVLGNLGAS